MAASLVIGQEDFAEPAVVKAGNSSDVRQPGTFEGE
jgi:hypothetical protein